MRRPTTKPVHSRQHGYAAYVSRDYEMQDADALIAVNPQLAQAAVNIGHLEGLLVLIAGVVSGRHDERDKFRKCRQGTQQTTFLTVSKAAFVFAHWYHSQYGFNFLSIDIIQVSAQ